MAVEFTQGDLLRAETEAVVNTVNAVGVMGKGIALQFKQAYPDNFKAYKRACDAGEVTVGRVFVVDRGTLTSPRYIVNFPTKRHWRSKSRLDDIREGLADLRRWIDATGVKSIAVPPLGCGNGGLNWGEVAPQIKRALDGLDAEVLVYEPAGAPDPEMMIVRTKRPSLNPNRAAVLGVFAAYADPGYRLNRLEAQKLAYFLQAAGLPLRLDFARGLYGPYAEKLNFVLENLEGHYIRGFGDRSGRASMRLTEGTHEEVESLLDEHADVAKAVARVSALIDGFETPYGLELLSTVHWLAVEDRSVASDPDLAAELVAAWSGRKQRMFRPFHVHKAWERLHANGWMPSAN